MVSGQRNISQVQENTYSFNHVRDAEREDRVVIQIDAIDWYWTCDTSAGAFPCL